MVTMIDVAKLAGVSTTTVSHVLNGTRSVSERTQRAVQDAVVVTGYVQNHLARSLVTASTRSIGLALSTRMNPYFGEVVEGIEAATVARGFTLLIADTHDDADQEHRVVTALRQRRVDGLILAASAGATRLLDELAHRAVPVVLIDRLPSERFDQVGVENEQPTAELVRHLAGHGHQRIAMVAGREGLTTSAERLAGYRRAVMECGGAVMSELVANGHSTSEGGRDAVRRLLQLAVPPTAFIIANNAMTVGALRAIREAGKRVPEDVAVVAFDDVEWADLLYAPLTAIAQPTELMGTTAVDMLFARIADPARSPSTVRLPARVIVRDSCGCNRS